MNKNMLALANCSAWIYFPITAPHTGVYYLHKKEEDANHSLILRYSVSGSLLALSSFFYGGQWPPREGQGCINISLYESCIGCMNGIALGMTNQCSLSGRLNPHHMLHVGDRL